MHLHLPGQQAVFSSGYFEHEGQLYEGADAIGALISSWSDEGLLIDAVGACFGNFAFGACLGSFAFAAVDLVRSYPIFYATRDGVLEISDTVDALTGGNPDSLSASACLQMRYAGYVTGDSTVCVGINQLEAGTVLLGRIDEDGMLEVKILRYYDRTVVAENADIVDWHRELDHVLDSVFRRLVDSLKGRTAVIPLSGGLDSRLVLAGLCKYQYQPIIAYSYGKRNSYDATKSMQVAEKLGIPWRFVDYSREQWGELYRSDDFARYTRYASNGVSIPHIQDFLAIRRLADDLPRDSLFIPGHSLDFIAGSHIPLQWGSGSLRVSDVIEQILGSHFGLWPLPPAHRESLARSIEIQLGCSDRGKILSAEEAAAEYERWDWLERQSKFIVNSVRVYEYFGFGWRLPFWDRQLVDFWGRVPLAERVGRLLCRRYLMERNPMGVFNQTSRSSRTPRSLLRKIPLITNLYRSPIVQFFTHEMQWYGIWPIINVLSHGLNARHVNALISHDMSVQMCRE